MYPESAIVQGRIRAGGILSRLVRWLDGHIAKSSAAVIAVAESFARVYRQDRKMNATRLRVVPNWIDGNTIVRLTEEIKTFRSQVGIPANAFVMAYGGNIGMAAGVETLIECLNYLRDVDGLFLVVAGEGGNLAACQSLAKKVDAHRIAFVSPWPAADTSLLLSAADLLLLPTRGHQTLASVPSKLIAYMLAARPVIGLALEGTDTARTIRESSCGWVVEPDRPDQLAGKIREVVQLSRSDMQRRGDAGREYALKNLTREVCLPRVISVLESVATGLFE
jgi:glycosyltransferase involved in cell wall biosynthesis